MMNDAPKKIEMNNPKDGFPIEFNRAARSLGRYDNTSSEAFCISKIVPVNKYNKVLDICCGFGRTSFELHALGYEVTGIDISPRQLELARSINPGPAYIQADMRTPPGERYDAIVNLFTSFGYLDSESEDLETLKAWHQKLRVGGVLIMELADMECARAKLPLERPVFTRGNGTVIENCMMDWEQRIFCVTYVQDDSSFTCYTRLYEKEELKIHLLNSGFSKVDMYGSLSLKPKEERDNLIVVATR